jgi:hypothetical protein
MCTKLEGPRPAKRELEPTPTEEEEAPSTAVPAGGKVGSSTGAKWPLSELPDRCCCCARERMEAAIGDEVVSP